MQANEVVPFLAVRSMAASLTFYVDGLGFAMEKKWEVDGAVRWCQLRLGKASLMLQEYAKAEDRRGAGVTLCIFLDDAVEFYREVTPRGVETSAPRVENGLWATHLTDPDGYRLLFESPTDAAEGTSLRV